MKKHVAWAVTVVTAATCALGAVGPVAAATAVTPAATTAPATPAVAAAATALTSSTTVDPKLQAIFENDFLAKLPSGWQDRVQALYDASGADGELWTQVGQAAIDPGSYQCSSTAFTNTAHSLSGALKDPGSFGFWQAVGLLNLPFYEAMLFGKTSPSNQFGYNGEYTSELTSEMSKLQGFWDIPSSDVQLIPMKNDIYLHQDRIVRVLSAVYGLSTADATLFASEFYPNYFAYEPSLQNGMNPLLTFNAFSYSEEGSGQPKVISDRIVVGDGILKTLADVGFGDVAPKAILAHEFGHQVQFEDNLRNDPSLTGPEASRRLELMADALGTYYLTNKHGGTYNAKELLPTEQNFYQIGDCQFLNPSHHGTPDQRLAASEFGASLAQDASNQGHIMPSLTFDAKFEADLPTLVAPNATPATP